MILELDLLRTPDVRCLVGPSLELIRPDEGGHAGVGDSRGRGAGEGCQWDEAEIGKETVIVMLGPLPNCIPPQEMLVVGLGKHTLL